MVRYRTHKEVQREAMKDWRYRFWYYLLAPWYKFAAFVWVEWKIDIFPG